MQRLSLTFAYRFNALARPASRAASRAARRPEFARLSVLSWVFVLAGVVSCDGTSAATGGWGFGGSSTGTPGGHGGSSVASGATTGGTSTSGMGAGASGSTTTGQGTSGPTTTGIGAGGAPSSGTTSATVANPTTTSLGSQVTRTDAGAAVDGGPVTPQPSAPSVIPTQAWSRGVAAGGTYVDGAPIGGLGAGTVTWRFDGQFYLDRLTIGGGITTTTTPYGSSSAFGQTVDPNAGFFMYQKAGSAAATTHRLDSTLGANQATYYALFPRSWVEYTGTAFPCNVTVEQFSPIIPNDYQRTSYPVGIYRWQITNSTASPCDVAVMLTWRNTYGGQSAVATTNGTNVVLTLQRGTTAATTDQQGEFSLATQTSPGVTVSYQSAADLTTLQTAFSTAGTLANTTGSDPMGAIAFNATVQPGGSTIVPMVLAWDIPIANASASQGATTTANSWYREYTKYYAQSGLSFPLKLLPRPSPTKARGSRRSSLGRTRS